MIVSIIIVLQDQFVKSSVFGVSDTMKKSMIADMHTHSRFSHDSLCPIEEMCLSQIQKGTGVFAVTDHCDVASFRDYDVFTPIRDSYRTVEALNQKYADKCQILSGVEISEGFWFPEQYQKIHDLEPYDVIIGSVHCVKCKDLEMAYSKIDFSRLSSEKIHEYLVCYFEDMITMLQTEDFDVLAHLTCPLRYIEGKYRLLVDLSKYDSLIKTILKIAIERKIALEINTSSYDALRDFMPGEMIIRRYYDMGGRLLTFGSDAHIAGNASVHFEDALRAARKLGFEHICYYKERMVQNIKI